MKFLFPRRPEASVNPGRPGWRAAGGEEAGRAVGCHRALLVAVAPPVCARRPARCARSKKAAKRVTVINGEPGSPLSAMGGAELC